MATDSSRRRAAAVTGGAAGIGLAACREFLCRGMADATQKVVPAPADVRDSAAVDAAIASGVEEMGGLDVLVNCAGITDRAPAAEMTDASWSRMLDVHMSGTFRCCRAAFAALRDSDSAAIVSVSSVAAYLGFPLRASYCAAKSGIEALTRSLAVEWAAHGIRVNAVAPWWRSATATGRAPRRGASCCWICAGGDCRWDRGWRRPTARWDSGRRCGRCIRGPRNRPAGSTRPATCWTRCRSRCRAERRR